MQSNTDFTDRVHREVSIDAYISRYVNLKRQGNRLVGLCPFHTEKTPSFQVSPERGVYHCFGCHKSGDIFRFVMDFDRVDFNRAKEILSAYSGIPVKSFSSAETSGKNEKMRLFELNKKIMDYYSKNLHSSDGHVAMDYLSSRNLSEASIRFFSVGYSLPGFDNLLRDILKEPEDIRLAVKLGILKEKEKSKGAYYDFFRDRIMFPILDVNGNVTGFGGRALGPVESAKYINSPASPIYDKGKMFYNLNNAAQAIRRNRTAILVEGYMDVIGIHSKEIENVVAPLGTALTEFQVRTIKNYADRLIIMLDGDKAGRAAALRASEICLKENLSSAVVLLENGTDPYDLSRTASKQEILPLFENAISSADFMIRESIQGAVPTSPPDIKRKAVQNLFALVKGMQRDTDRQSYLEEGARKLGLSLSAVLSDFYKENNQSFAPLKTDNSKTQKNESAGKIPASAIRCERKIIAMLILNNELFSDAGDISRINFLDSESAFLWDYIYTKFLNGEEISAEEILASDIPESSRNAIAPFMVESDDYRDSEIEDKRNIFEQLFHQQKIFVHQAEMEQLVLKKTYSEEEEYAKISEIVFHRTEIEKHHDSIRNSSFTTT